MIPATYANITTENERPDKIIENNLLCYLRHSKD